MILNLLLLTVTARKLSMTGQKKSCVVCVCVCVSMSCKNIRLLCDVFDIFEQALISKTVEPCKKNVGSLRICYYCLG